MSLPSTGKLSFLAIRTELGKIGAIDLNNSSVRGLAGKASGAISFSDLRGKSNIVSFSSPKPIPTDLYVADDVQRYLSFSLTDIKTVTISVPIVVWPINTAGENPVGAIGVEILNSSNVVVSSDVYRPTSFDPKDAVTRTYSAYFTSSNALGENLTVRIVYKRFAKFPAWYGYKTNGVFSIDGTKKGN